MVDEVKPIVYAEEYHGDKPSIFRESENLDRLLQAIFDVCYQQQLDFLWLSQNLLNVDVAEKSHLDFIGNIVGQPRFLSDFNTEPYFGYEGSYQSKTFGSSLDPEVGGYWNSRSHFNTATARQLNDDEYRRLIKARAIYNHSNCTANDLLEVVNLITDSVDNTVQLLKHGLIQIKTSDTTGILSYFVDRLYLEDNILPIAAGVRVGLEEVGESGVSDGDSSNKMSFLKFHQRILNKDLGQEIGIHYSVNDGEIEKFSFQTVTETSPSVSWEVLGVISNYQYGLGAILGYGSKAFGWETGLPEGLSGDYVFSFGGNEEVIREVLEFEGMELPPEIPLIEENFKLTYYPQSAVSSSSLDFDVFSLLIDPSDYTPEDLKYFKELGIKPATKNADGSYTIHSTARIQMF